MNWPALLLLLGLTVAVFASSDHGHTDHDEAHELTERGVIRPLTEFLERARQVRDGRVLDVKLKPGKGHAGYLYRLEILDTAGKVWELEFDAVTGELIEHHEEKH